MTLSAANQAMNRMRNTNPADRAAMPIAAAARIEMTSRFAQHRANPSWRSVRDGLAAVKRLDRQEVEQCPAKPDEGEVFDDKGMAIARSDDDGQPD